MIIRTILILQIILIILIIILIILIIIIIIMMIIIIILLLMIIRIIIIPILIILILIIILIMTNNYNNDSEDDDDNGGNNNFFFFFTSEKEALRCKKRATCRANRKKPCRYFRLALEGLGQDRWDISPPKYRTSFPPHILRQILSYLPMEDRFIANVNLLRALGRAKVMELG